MDSLSLDNAGGGSRGVDCMLADRVSECVRAWCGRGRRKQSRTVVPGTFNCCCCQVDLL